MFEECLRITRTKCIYLTIGNIDALYPQCSDREENQRFALFIERLKALVFVHEITFKVLITARQPSGYQFLSSSHGSPMDPTRHKVISVPRGPQRGPMMFGKTRRIFRLPTVSKSFPPNHAKLETFLAMDDEDGDEEEDEQEATEEKGNTGDQSADSASSCDSD